MQELSDFALPYGVTGDLSAGKAYIHAHFLEADLRASDTALRLPGSQRLGFYNERFIWPVGTALPTWWQGFCRVYHDLEGIDRGDDARQLSVVRQ